MTLETESPPSTERPKLRRVAAVVNPYSGGVGPHAADQLEALLADAGLDAHVAAPGHERLQAALQAAIADRPGLLIVLAGDGTARAAAALCGPAGPLLAPLPGGTMNMLPKALYGERRWQAALHEILDHGVVRPVSGGEADGRAFYVAAVLGAPALWAPAREAARDRKLRLAVLRAQRAVRQAFSGRVRYALDGEGHEKAEALTFVCPLVSRAMHAETALEAAAVNPSGPQDVLRLGVRAFFGDLFGDWRDDPAVSLGRCRAAHVWARRWIPATLDGEPARLPRDVRVRFVPLAFHALVPPPEAAPETPET